MLEFTKYYASVRLFVSVVIVAEMPLTGRGNFGCDTVNKLT